MSDSIANAALRTDQSEPKKTRTRTPKDFPLVVHKAKQLWCKSIRGKRVYFERLDQDPDGSKSLEFWNRHKDEIIATGRKPTREAGALTTAELCNFFMSHKRAELEKGRIVERTWNELFQVCEFFLSVVGKTRLASSLDALDFSEVSLALSKRFNVVSQGKRIGQIKSIFKYGDEAGLLDSQPRFGPGFKKPTAKQLRTHRNEKGRQDYSNKEILDLLKHTTPNQKAMILLGVQAGFGNTDIAELSLDAMDLEKGWIDWPRKKTGVARRVPLWRETIQALQDVLKNRPQVDSDLVFISKRGNDYRQTGEGGWRIAGEFCQVCERAKVDNRGFYSLRRTFQTIAEESGDFPAIKAIMGHSFSETDMSARYRQIVVDERLQRVTNTVHDWLFK